ncbi:unnamed protein product [Brassica oleracea]|uniref:(rape) hypothetical protein n=1 Tax=Brassica napus TaxID=3708 RepID=A0A816JSA1_BRANA|nr:unnamed protein product [Brassica napus]
MCLQETEEMEMGRRRRRTGENRGGVSDSKREKPQEQSIWIDKEEEDENDKVAVGEELRHVRSIALKNQLYAVVGALLLTTIFFFSIKEVKHKVQEEEDKHGDDCELDLLYIVHSDISSLLHQEDPSLMTARVFPNAAANQ